MKVLLTGGKGMLGRTLASVLNTTCEVLVTDHAEADITDYPAISAIIRRCRPDAVIHCAAVTAVDRCETETTAAYEVNAYGAANVARACAAGGVRLIAISTDYVFDGTSDVPYKESDFASGGATVYGRSKRAGEELILGLCPGALICRLAWLYGTGGPSFLHTILKLADGSRPVLKVVNDQYGTPTSAFAVAKHLAKLLQFPELSGICHLTCEGEATWYDFAVEICRQRGIRQEIIPCTTAEYPRPASRPAYSVLDNGFLRENGLPPMPAWEVALTNFFRYSSIW